MTEKLDRFEIIRAILDPDSVKEGTPAYDVDKAFQQWVYEKSSILLDRYKQRHSETHWQQNELKNMRIGMSAQLAFEHLLQYMKISYDADNPSEPAKPYDFKLRNKTTVEVKGYDHYCEVADVKGWKGNDFLVVWQFGDKEGMRIIFRGWLNKQEVEKYGITPKGKSKYTPYGEAIIIPMNDLHTPKTAKFLT